MIVDLASRRGAKIAPKTLRKATLATRNGPFRKANFANDHSHQRTVAPLRVLVKGCPGRLERERLFGQACSFDGTGRVAARLRAHGSGIKVAPRVREDARLSAGQAARSRLDAAVASRICRCAGSLSAPGGRRRRARRSTRPVRPAPSRRCGRPSPARRARPRARKS